MQIYPVQTRSQWKEFVHFPYQLHREDQNWIPPLIAEQKKIFDPERNSMLQHCDHQLFLLKTIHKLSGELQLLLINLPTITGRIQSVYLALTNVFRMKRLHSSC